MSIHKSGGLLSSPNLRSLSHVNGALGTSALASLVSLLLLLVPGSKGFAQRRELVVPQTYEAFFADSEIVIDGKGDEQGWEKTPFSDKFIDIEGEITPQFETRMKMLWDEHYLYFYAEMEEPHVWGTLKQRDTVIFYNNDFEIFIDPDGDTHEYYEFEMNALNTVWDLLLVKPYRNGGSVLDHWNINGLKTAVHIDGSLNDASDEDRGWSVEIAMPWDVLSEASHMPVPPEGKFWRVNFSRVNWDHDLKDGRYSRKKDEDGNFAPEYNWVWSAQQVVNMHEPERWGYVYFKPQGEVSTFEIPEAEVVKWRLYAIYRELIRDNGSLTEQIRQGKSKLPALWVDGSEVAVAIEFHHGGWNLVATDPSGQGVHMIQNDGKYRFK
ncbi:carbohydrate-binding family 9-like protein [Robertkochia sediminum]|uniref:carbohydrate-binding family 9-like protein n=1 Tax=Robertkochia sediminum TaxID=2785326 RepID=UPI001933687B|nr:carbohydrate-binding family 9-like protein [Robertkochia sediminum]MBL7472389.1 carbohydrate-binding family 9-like protein [Robertkochia sediminum]